MTKENTQLVTVQDKVTALREQSGVVGKSTTTYWPNKLSVNREPLDKDNNQLPMGKFRIDTEQGMLFFDTVKMVVVKTGTQYSVFEKVGDKITGFFTMIETGYQGEYKDTKGGNRLGRPVSSKGMELTEDQKKVKFTYHVLGIADVTNAVDRQGKKVFTEETFLPVAMSFRGKKSVSKQDELKKLRKKKESFVDFFVTLEKPFRDGEMNKTPLYDFKVTRGDKLEHTEMWVDSMSAVLNLLEEENRRLYAKHLAAAQGGDTQEVVEGTYTDLDLGE